MPDFYTVVTDSGLQALGLAFNSRAKHFSYTCRCWRWERPCCYPNKGMEPLANEVWRGDVAGMKVDPEDPNTLIFEFVSPADTGVFTIEK